MITGNVIMIVSSRLFGTIFAQVLFIPGAKYISWVTQFMSSKKWRHSFS